MQRVKAKICGITNAGDAKAAARAGADIIGMIFAKSPRRITPVKARSISGSIPRGVKKAGVFVNEEPAEINRLIKMLKLDYVQLCGNEEPADIRRIKGAKKIKAIMVKSGKEARAQVKKYKNCVSFFLFDAYKKGKHGGTGKLVPLKHLKSIKAKKKFFIAGGINPSNAVRIIKAVKPYGIDVGSGVEKSKGKKSRAKLLRLFEGIRKYR